MKYPQASPHFLLLMPFCLPQHPILEHSQLINQVLPKYEMRVFPNSSERWGVTWYTQRYKHSL